MALTKAEISESLALSLGLNKRDANDIVENLFEEVRLALIRGESVNISRFGNFNLRDKAERPGRNPKTGETVTISARRVVTFNAGQLLKSRVKKFKGIAEAES